ncbi:MAG: DUF4870 domain-containing protein [Chlorobia bacterium]|nr:DUF4870 domain-containing protein [Fimbriimonadaceae bacterium]
MDENKPPEEPTIAPAPEPTPTPAPTSSATNFANMASAATAGAPTGGPVPFSGPPDPSIPQEQRTHALLSWLLMFVISFISPLIFFLIAKEDKPFVKQHAATGLTLVIVNVAAAVVIVILGIILAFAGPLALLILPIWGIYGLAVLALVIMGAIAGNAGSQFDPPLIGNLRRTIFKV